MSENETSVTPKTTTPNSNSNPGPNQGPNSGSKSGRKRRIIKVIFGLSLGVNFLILAAVGTTVWRFSGASDHGRPPPGIGLAVILALPAESREALRAELRTQSNTQGQNGARQAAREEILTLLGAPEFDATGFEQALVRSASGGQQKFTRGAAGVARMVGEMSAEERASYADAVRERFRRRPRH